MSKKNTTSKKFKDIDYYRQLIDQVLLFKKDKDDPSSQLSTKNKSKKVNFDFIFFIFAFHKIKLFEPFEECKTK